MSNNCIIVFKLVGLYILLIIEEFDIKLWKVIIILLRRLGG